MTTLGYNQIKENFNPAKLVHEVLKIHNDNSTHASNASSENLRQDFAWKKTYLEIKADAKTLDEVIHQLESLYNHSL